MKYIKILLLSALFSPGVFAASCELDKVQMYNQIGKYQSISTAGCPVNGYGLGVNQVLNVLETTSSTCSAVCFYLSGPGSQGVQCNWSKGDWGNTLACR